MLASTLDKTASDEALGFVSIVEVVPVLMNEDEHNLGARGSGSAGPIYAFPRFPGYTIPSKLGSLGDLGSSACAFLLHGKSPGLQGTKPTKLGMFPKF